MKKVILAVVLGSLVYFAWGAISWMVLPFHNKALKSLPEEQLLIDTMKVVIKTPGFYAFPSQHDASGQPVDAAGWKEKMIAGPTGVVIFDPAGKPPMSPRQFLVSFIIGFVASVVSYLLLLFTRDQLPALGSRVFLLSLVGLLCWVVSDVSYANWFWFPTGFVLANLVDLVVGFALLALVMHPFVPERD